jgi:CRISPR system Cascade subunit CasC
MVNNPYLGKKIEFHVLQSFPVNCLNRDDVGSPKTAIVGGVTRARVSSQCWKRAVRLKMQELGIKLGIRTKNLSEILAKKCIKNGAKEEDANKVADKISSSLTEKTLMFFSEIEAEAFAEYAKDCNFDHSKINDKEVIKIAKKVLNPSMDGLDIALFGRMVASAPELQLEAAASFSHAISTHKVSNEIDFFTALDDFSDKQGSAHMGTLEYSSATYYRYISLDLGQLYDNLNGVEISKAVEVFTKALFLAVPGAHQKTLSAYCSWEYAKILVRKGQRLQASFEKPIKERGNGYLQESINSLNSFLEKKEHQFGSLFQKIDDLTFGENSELNIDLICNKLTEHLR